MCEHRMRYSFSVSGAGVHVPIQRIGDWLVCLRHSNNGNDTIPETMPAFFETIDFSI